MEKKPRFTANQLRAQLTQHIQELAQATDAARVSTVMQRYLDSCAKFHRYSLNNTMLIMMAMPEATRVAGFHRWKSMGRYVKRGEKGIPILAPIFKKVNDGDEEEGELVAFKVVYVYDISQTEGDPIPEPPSWKSGEKDQELSQRLRQFAQERDIHVKVEELSGDTQGVSRGGEIVLAPQAGTKILIHELAHEMLHQGEEKYLDKRLKELEAESVAYVVGRHFGLHGITSPNYVALHGADSELIMAHLGRIQETAADIICNLEENSSPDKKGAVT